jgi:hypothetical protein
LLRRLHEPGSDKTSAKLRFGIDTMAYFESAKPA